MITTLLKLLTLIFFSTTFPFNGYKPFTIMLNPAGDAQCAGRTINDSFERGITLKFAQDLKSILESKFKKIRVIITRTPGESLEHLQNANFSNRLNADFFLSIHFYKETNLNNQVYLLHYVINPFNAKINTQLHFYTFDNAYLFNLGKTLDYAQIFKDQFNYCSNVNVGRYCSVDYYGMPFKPLVGIVAPALALEMGIKNNDDIQAYLQPITNALQQIIIWHLETT